MCLSTLLLAEKSLERLGNEAEAAADNLYESKEYLKAAEKYKEAIDYFEKAHEELGIPVEDKVNGVLEKIWKAYYFGKSYENSIKYLNEKLAKNPKNYEIMKLIVQIYEKKLKNIDKAIEALKKYDAQNQNYKAEKKIASLYYKLDKYAESVEWFKKAYDKRQEASTIKNIATLYQKIGQKKEAIQAYKDFIKTNPNNYELAKTYTNMAKFYEDLNNMNEAIEYYKKSVDVRYRKDIYLKIISVYYDLNNYPQALKFIDKLLEKDADNDNAIYYRALIYYEQGKKEAAKSDFQKLTSNSKFAQTAKKYIESIESE